MAKKLNEAVIVKDGKLIFAVQLKERSNSKNSQYIYIKHGEVVYEDDRWMRDISEFDFTDELHAVAKSVFVDQLRTAVRTKIAEVKQLELVLENLGLAEIFSTAPAVAMLMQPNGEAVPAPPRPPAPKRKTRAKKAAPVEVEVVK